MNLEKINADTILHGLMSPEKIRKISKTEVTSSRISTDQGCLLDINIKEDNCFGSLELSRPLIHPDFSNVIYHLLKFTCRKCARVLLPQKLVDSLSEKNQKILKTFSKLRTSPSIKKCPHCGAEQKEIQFKEPYAFTENGNSLNPIDIRRRLEMIPLSDAKLFGVPEDTKPEWMIMTVLPIPPVTVRPKPEDPLNEKLSELVSVNLFLRKSWEEGIPVPVIEGLWKALQQHVNEAWNLLPSKQLLNNF
ncbi:hypothetical protein AKJ61_03930 [candidate division MSBL1 archaeon SCGC-AAA259B11]|uniref:DNA-directed RNA polymerase n=1 Tax=candidate division MSBL1 archaeon SCGC-AAA259B11 TaxID=1698260 RepID=A0A133U407_9EURY|nr:hypothetical protein AKJ61_03930 [candidate division MSBL1 archaeon SCGC-AAA259B11]